MTINWKWPGWVWLENATENSIGAAAISAGTLLGSSKAELIGDVPWYAMLSVAAIAALGSFLNSLASLHIHNGTSSWLRRVIAKPNNGG